MRLINYNTYKAVTLTPEGARLAEDVARRHQALRNFFVNVLGVESGIAEKAACGMEHAVPSEIIDRLADFAAAVLHCPQTNGTRDGACKIKARRTAAE